MGGRVSERTERDKMKSVVVPLHCKDTPFCFVLMSWQRHSFFHTISTCFSLERIKNAKPISAFTLRTECALSRVSSVSSFSHNVCYILHAASQFPSLLPVKAAMFLVMLFPVANVGKYLQFCSREGGKFYTRNSVLPLTDFF